jgi:hypothetical protein
MKDYWWLNQLVRHLPLVFKGLKMSGTLSKLKTMFEILSEQERVSCKIRKNMYDLHSFHISYT